MIHVRFEKSGKSIILTLRGHAGMAQEGQDIVCAAATILAYTVAQNVLIMHEKGRLRKRPAIRMEKGDIMVVCKPGKRSYTEAMHLYAVAQVGYQLLEQSHPQYVNLTKFDSGEKP